MYSQNNPRTLFHASTSASHPNLNDHLEAQLNSARSKRYKCGLHVQIIYFTHSIIIVILDISAIIIFLVFLFSPSIIRYLPIYRLLFKNYDRTHNHQFQFIICILSLFMIVLYLLHTFLTSLSIYAIQREKPLLVIPQLVFLLLRVGLLLIASGSFIFADVVMGVTHVSTYIVTFFLLSASSYLLSSILCFRWLFERWCMMKKILAAQKSVHFKRKRRRK